MLVMKSFSLAARHAHSILTESEYTIYIYSIDVKHCQALCFCLVQGAKNMHGTQLVCKLWNIWINSYFCLFIVHEYILSYNIFLIILYYILLYHILLYYCYININIYINMFVCIFILYYICIHTLLYECMLQWQYEAQACCRTLIGFLLPHMTRAFDRSCQGNKIGQHCDGGYSELCRVQAEWLVPKPAAFSLEDPSNTRLVVLHSFAQKLPHHECCVPKPRSTVMNRNASLIHATA